MNDDWIFSSHCDFYFRELGKLRMTSHLLVKSVVSVFVVISALILKIHWTFTHRLNRSDPSECLRDGVEVFQTVFFVVVVARLGWWRWGLNQVARSDLAMKTITGKRIFKVKVQSRAKENHESVLNSQRKHSNRDSHVAMWNRQEEEHLYIWKRSRDNETQVIKCETREVYGQYYIFKIISYAEASSQNQKKYLAFFPPNQYTCCTSWGQRKISQDSSFDSCEAKAAEVVVGLKLSVSTQDLWSSVREIFGVLVTSLNKTHTPKFSVCSDNQLYEVLVDPKFFHFRMWRPLSS